MSIFSRYSKHTNLDKRTARPYKSEREYDMPINNKKIRREVSLNGAKVWITANTEQEYADKIARLSGGAQKPVNRHRFSDYAIQWYEFFSKPNVEEVTAITYKRQLDNHILPVLGDLFLENITVLDVQRVFNSMGDVSKETKSKVKTVLNQIFKMAEEDRLIDYNPLHSTTLRIKGNVSATTEPYSVAEMRFFASNLNRIEDEEDRAWLALSISLPLRPEEVLGLRWKDIDEASGLLKVRSTITHPDRNQPEFKEYTKTESSMRDLRMSDWLISYLPQRGRPLEFVIGRIGPLSYTRVRRMRERIAREIGYDGVITPRRFRTTVATDISDMTHDLKLVQRMLGHATPQMTLRHYDKGRSTAIDAANAIGKCYGF